MFEACSQLVPRIRSLPERAQTPADGDPSETYYLNKGAGTMSHRYDPGSFVIPTMVPTLPTIKVADLTVTALLDCVHRLGYHATYCQSKVLPSPKSQYSSKRLGTLRSGFRMFEMTDGLDCSSLEPPDRG